ncbi:MAG: diacylglycerol kinase family protein, partial [Bradymonadaceae bacterium]
RLVVVGGDGTIHEVVNGLREKQAPVTLGIIPAGTGNDTARSLNLPLDPADALEVAVETGVERTIDLLRAEWADGDALAINAINGGYAPEVADDITDEMKGRYGPLAYLAAAPQAWRDAESYATKLRWSDGTEEIINALALIAAHGRTIGGGFTVAPEADLADGCFDVFCVQTGSVVDMAGIAARLGSGTLADSNHVVHRTTTGVRVQTTPPMRFTLDGEPIQVDITNITLEADALRLIVPPPAAD